MAYKEIFRILGNYLFFFSAVLVLPLLVDLYYYFFLPLDLHPQPFAYGSFIWAILLSLVFGGLFKIFGKGVPKSIYRREGLILVAAIWLISGIFGSLPFMISGTLEDPVDAFFESVSAFTTTGASALCAKKYDKKTGEEVPYIEVFSKEPKLTYVYYGTVAPIKSEATGKVLYQGIEAVSKSLLFWRSFMQWLGGMGIVVLFIAILPALGVGGKFLYQAEVPGPVKDGMTPRIKDTASLLWKLYIVLSIFQVVFLMITNGSMSFYEAVTVMFSTISTGGFSTKNASIGAFNSASTEWVVTIFMLVGSISFTLYYFIVRGKFYRIFQKELITYFIVIFGGAFFSAWALTGILNHYLIGGSGFFSPADAVRQGSFQFISMLTSTGFSTSNYNLWPYKVQIMCLLAMYVGSMAGSTGGGIKIARHLILFGVIREKIQQIFRPERVQSHHGMNPGQSEKVTSTVLIFVLLVLTLSIIGTFLLIADNVDPDTAFSVNSCMINNVGASFKMAGPTSSFAFLSPLSKLICVVLMVLGRLELFAILVLFVPSFWRFR